MQKRIIDDKNLVGRGALGRLMKCIGALGEAGSEKKYILGQTRRVRKAAMSEAVRIGPGGRESIL